MPRCTAERSPPADPNSSSPRGAAPLPAGIAATTASTDARVPTATPLAGCPQGQPSCSGRGCSTSTPPAFCQIVGNTPKKPPRRWSDHGVGSKHDRQPRRSAGRPSSAVASRSAGALPRADELWRPRRRRSRRSELVPPQEASATAWSRSAIHASHASSRQRSRLTAGLAHKGHGAEVAIAEGRDAKRCAESRHGGPGALGNPGTAAAAVDQAASLITNTSGCPGTEQSAGKPMRPPGSPSSAAPAGARPA